MPTGRLRKRCLVNSENPITRSAAQMGGAFFKKSLTFTLGKMLSWGQVARIPDLGSLIGD